MCFQRWISTVHAGGLQYKIKRLTQVCVRRLLRLYKKRRCEHVVRSGSWSGIRESNPLENDIKPLKTLRFLLDVSIFVSILRKKSGHSVFRLDPVSVCNVCVNAYHGLVVRPSAELHHL